MKVMNGLNLNSQKITSLADGTSATDAVTKQQLDNATLGLDWRPHVRATSSSNVTISGPGTTIDGVTMNNGDRVLLIGQSTTSQNGLWVFNGSGSALTRPTDFTGTIAANSAAKTVLTTEGTTNADKVFTLSTDAAIVVGTDANSWVQIGAGTTYSAGNGLSLASNTFTVVAADSSISVGAGGVTVGTVTVAKGGTNASTAAGARANLGAVGKYANTISLTAATPLTVNHALGTTDVTVALYDAVSTGNLVMADVQITDANNLTITSATTVSNYRVVVTG